MPVTGSHSINPLICLLTAKDALQLIAAPGEAVRGALVATQEIIKAAVLVDDVPAAFPEISRSISRQLWAACPIVTAATPNMLTPEQVWFGFGRVNDLVGNGSSRERGFSLNHAAIFQAELTITLHRAHLIKHGRECMAGALVQAAARSAAQAR